MVYTLLKLSHLVGLAAWFGGQVSAMVLITADGAGLRSDAAYRGIVRKVLLWLVMPGLVLTLLSGVTNLMLRHTFLLQLGWMHAKLGAVLVATVCGGWLLWQGLLFSETDEPTASPARLKALAGLWLATLALSLIFVLFRWPGLRA